MDSPEKIEKNEVQLLSHIIYTIYNTKNGKQMRKEVLELLQYAVPFDTANFFLVKADASGNDCLTDLVNVNCLKNPDVSAVLNRYMQECSTIDATHWLCKTNKSITYRVTDFLSEETLENTDYYKEMFVPHGLHYGAQTVLAHNERCLGLLTLFRTKEGPNFSDKEIFYLDNLKDHLSVRLDQREEAPTASRDPAALTERYDLTRREAEVLDLLYAGCTNETIADKLYISENTLRRHLYNLYSKLHIKHRWELFFLE